MTKFKLINDPARATRFDDIRDATALKREVAAATGRPCNVIRFADDYGVIVDTVAFVQVDDFGARGERATGTQ